MTRASPTLSMEKAQQQQFREPPPASLTINAVSSNSNNSTRPHAISPNDYSDDSPGSYSSYSSADYSSIGVLASNNNSTMKRSTFNSTIDAASQDGSAAGIVGHGLLSEVLKMQGLLEEYQHALTALEIEKADKQQEINKLDRLLKGKGQTEERYKDEIWNLELNKQELLQKIHDLSQRLGRSTSEQNRLAKEEAKLCLEIEHFKTVQHTWESNLTSAQEQHDEETLALKKTLYNLRAEKDQIAKQLQEVLAIQQQVAHQPNELRHVDKPSSSSEQEPASTTTTASNLLGRSSSSSTRSNSAALLEVRHQAEIAALNTSLDQAHEIIKTMQTKIDEERQERTEIDNLLREAQETIELFHQHRSPTASLLSLPPQQPHSPTSNSVSAPHSPASISNRQQQQRSSLKSTQRSSHSKRRFTGSSPYPPRAKSLGDELSQAGSVGNFMASSPVSSSSTEQTGNEPHPQPLDSKSTSSLHSQKTTPSKKPILLTCVALPCITNHDTLSSFLSSSSSATTSTSENTSNEQAQLQKLASNHEYYGSLIREPTSYIYKSKRDKNKADKQMLQQKSPSFKLNFGDHDFEVDADFSGRRHQQQDGEEYDSGSSAEAMTRTMIGDWMWKYTRKVVGSGISENRHRRFFWIHPYTQTLYWSTREPGANASQSNTKSVLVESFMVLPPHEPSRPPGIYIKSPSRGIQIQCLDFTAHYAWIKSLRYLLSDADHTQHVIPTIKKSATGRATIDRKKFSSLRQKNRSFTKLLDATPASLPNSAIIRRRDDGQEEQSRSAAAAAAAAAGVSSSTRDKRQPLLALFDNSTLIDLSIDQDPFIDLNMTLKH